MLLSELLARTTCGELDEMLALELIDPSGPRQLEAVVLQAARWNLWGGRIKNIPTVEEMRVRWYQPPAAPAEKRQAAAEQEARIRAEVEQAAAAFAAWRNHQ